MKDLEPLFQLCVFQYAFNANTHIQIIGIHDSPDLKNHECWEVHK